MPIGRGLIAKHTITDKRAIAAREEHGEGDIAWAHRYACRRGRPVGMLLLGPSRGTNRSAREERGALEVALTPIAEALRGWRRRRNACPRDTGWQRAK